MAILPDFDLSLIREALRTIDPELAQCPIEQPHSGLSGSIHRIHASTGDLILKVLEPGAAWKVKKEQVIYDLLRIQNIPAPRVIAADHSCTQFPFAYTLSTCLPGDTLGYYYDTLSPERQIDIYRQLGDYLGRMHSCAFPAFGDVEKQDRRITVGPAREWEGRADTGPFSSWKDMHRQIVRQHLALFQQTLFADLIGPLEEWFEAQEYRIDDAITPRLLHMDLHCGNILVKEGRITGIIDVEESLVGHNELDLMRTELAHFGTGYEAIQKAFLKAYTSHIPLDAGYESRKPFYELSRQLVAMRCLIQYGNRYNPSGGSEVDSILLRVNELLKHSFFPD